MILPSGPQSPRRRSRPAPATNAIARVLIRVSRLDPRSASLAASQPRQFAATIAVRVAVDRLLKNQNPLKNGNNLRPSSSHLVVGKRPGTAPQFCGPKFMDTRAIAVPIPNVRFRHSTVRRRALGGRRLARSPPRRVTHWLRANLDRRDLNWLFLFDATDRKRHPSAPPKDTGAKSPFGDILP